MCYCKSDYGEFRRLGGKEHPDNICSLRLYLEHSFTKCFTSCSPSVSLDSPSSYCAAVNCYSALELLFGYSERKARLTVCPKCDEPAHIDTSPFCLPSFNGHSFQPPSRNGVLEGRYYIGCLLRVFCHDDRGQTVDIQDRVDTITSIKLDPLSPSIRPSEKSTCTCGHSGVGNEYELP